MTTITVPKRALRRSRCSPVSMSRLLKYDKPRWMRPSLSTRNALAKGSPRCKCHHKKFALIRYRRMPTKKPLKKESTSQPTHGPLKSTLIIKELVQMRLTCSVAMQWQAIGVFANDDLGNQCQAGLTLTQRVNRTLGAEHLL